MTWLSLPGWVRRDRALTRLQVGRWAGSLARRFLLASLLIFVANGLLLGWWVGRQIQANVVHHAGASARSSWRVLSAPPSSRSCGLLGWMPPRQPYWISSSPTSP